MKCGTCGEPAGKGDPDYCPECEKACAAVDDLIRRGKLAVLAPQVFRTKVPYQAVCSECKDSLWLELGWPRASYGAEAGLLVTEVRSPLTPEQAAKIQAWHDDPCTPDSTPERHDHATLERFLLDQAMKGLRNKVLAAVDECKRFKASAPDLASELRYLAAAVEGSVDIPLDEGGGQGVVT